MKLIVALIALFAAPSAFAIEVDPFNPANACSGPSMSAQRALDLLGSSFSVNLAANENEKMLKGASRFRQIIQGMRGQWHLSAQGLFPISPFLVNRNGTIGINVYFHRWNGSRYESYEIACEPGDEAGFFSCVNRSDRAPVFGSNHFEGRLTGSCFSLFSSTESQAQEREWSFVLHF